MASHESRSSATKLIVMPKNTKMDKISESLRDRLCLPA